MTAVAAAGPESTHRYNPARVRNERLRDVGSAILLAAFVTLFFADILFAGLNIYTRDIARVYYPERQVLASILRNGEFPLWNPYFSAGQPLAANPGYQAFYPPQWLLALGDFREGFHLEVILHYPLAAAGLFFLSRSLGLSRMASLFAGFSYALGGTMVSLSTLLPFEFAMAWMPWLALFFRRFVAGRRVGDLAAATLILGLIILIADVSMILQAGGLIALYAAYATWKRRSDRSLHPIAGAVIAVVFATLIGAVQLVPALDHQRDSGRAAALRYDVAMFWPTHPLRPLETVWPTMFGASSEYAPFFWGAKRLIGRETVPWLLQMYPGIVATILVIAGLVLRIRGSGFVALVASLSFLLALGPRGGLFPLIYNAGFTSVRYPEKFILSAIFVLSVFAGVAADHALRDPRMRRAAAWIGGMFMVLTVGILAWTALPGFAARFARLWALVRVDADLADRFRSGMMLSLAILAIVTLLLALERISPRLRVALLALVVIVDLGIRQQGTMLRLTADYYTRPPAAERLLAEQTLLRVYSHADWQRLNEPQPELPFGIRHWIIRNGLLPGSNMTWNIPGIFEVDVTSTTLIPTIQFHQLFDALRKARRTDRFPLLMQMAGVSHVGVLQRYDSAIVNDPRRFDQIEPVRFVRTNNAGRYYFASTLQQASELNDVARILGSHDPVDARTVFLNRPSFTPAPGRVTAVRERANRIELDVESEGRAVLAIAVTPHKYWSATIDERPVQLERANVGFQALTMDRGAHKIRLTYDNTLVRRCAWISLAAALLTISVAFAGPLRSRGSQTPSPH